MRVAMICAFLLLFESGCLRPSHAQTAPTQEQQESKERVSYLREIVVEKGETIPVAVCVRCSITVRGTVRGEAVAIWGNVEVEGRIEGEAVVVGGSVLLRGNGAVEGDALTVRDISDERLKVSPRAPLSDSSTRRVTRTVWMPGYCGCGST